MRRKKIDWKFGIIYLLIAIAILGIGFQFYQELNTNWECAQTDCSRFMTQEEIAANICVEDDNGEMICRVNVDGQDVLIPLDQLSLTDLSFCAEYVCIKEIRIKDVNYPINLTFV